MAKLDFSKVKEMIDSSLDFSLTEEQYKRILGREMPKNMNYLIHESALSRFAKENGLDVVVHEREISFIKHK